MRDYLSTTNLVRAFAIGTVVTAMALPRIVDAGEHTATLVAVSLFCMTLVAAAVTAWSRKGGLQGLFRSTSDTWQGLAVAVIISLVMAPVLLSIVHPVIRAAVDAAADDQWARLQLPASPSDWMALALWSAGFQVLFAVMAPTCLAARLTGRIWPAYVLVAGLAVFIASRQDGA